MYEYSKDKIDVGLSCDLHVNGWLKRAHFQFIVTENSLWWTRTRSKISLIFKTLIHGPSNIFNLSHCSSAHLSKVYGRLYVTGIGYTSKFVTCSKTGFVEFSKAFLSCKELITKVLRKCCKFLWLMYYDIHFSFYIMKRLHCFVFKPSKTLLVKTTYHTQNNDNVKVCHIPFINQEWGHYREISDWGLVRSIHQGQGLRFRCNDQTG